MMLSNEECFGIIGGATTGTFINSISKLITTLLDVGRAIGSAIRYKTSKKTC